MKVKTLHFNTSCGYVVGCGVVRGWFAGWAGMRVGKRDLIGRAARALGSSADRNGMYLYSTRTCNSS
jgi:hypothetical protein